MAELQDKINALATFKGVSPSEVTFEGDDAEYPKIWDEFAVDGETYIVLTEDEADQALHDDIENFIDDVGLTGFAPDFFEWIKENALDQDWFREVCRESNEAYAYDIAYEDGRLEEECIDAEIITPDDLDDDGHYTGDLDLSEEYADYLDGQVDADYNGDFVQWYVDNFGNLNDIMDRVSYDFDAIVEEVKAWDGYGNNLARYDGKEHMQDDFYIFRQS